MLTKWKLSSCKSLFLLFTLLLLVLSCESERTYEGTYKADENESPRQIEITLELKPNGQGVWKQGDEEVPFSWYIKKHELRLNTKGGGVILGSFEQGVLRIDLPNHGMMSFKRAP